MRFIFYVYFFCVLLSLHKSDALWFHLKSGEKKCLRFDSPKNIITNGVYGTSENPTHSIDIIARDSKEHILYKRDRVDNGTFAFSTEEFDIVEVCFTSQKSHSALEHEIFFNIKQGAEAKNFDLLAKAEKLKPMETELKRLEALTDEIVRDFNTMHTKSTNMRATNESTHIRVLNFSILSMVILIGFACWQVIYLRRYFKSKKLIE